MKNSMKTLVVLAILAIAGLANAQSSANANATANATIVCPISIVNTANLEFGTIVNTSTGGTMTVATNDGTSFTGGLSSYTGSAAHATPHAADFTVGGQSGFSYSITPTIVTNFGGSGATLGTLTSSQGSTNTFGTGGGCVTNVLDIGGTITITSAASGAYSATINVAVAYN